MIPNVTHKYYLFFIVIVVVTNMLMVFGLTDENLIPRFTFLSFFVIISLIFWYPNKGKSSIKLSVIGLMLTAFYLYSLLSVSWATNTSQALFEAQKIILLVSVFFLVRRFLIQDEKHSLKALLIASLIYAGILSIMTLLELLNIYQTDRIDRGSIHFLIGFSGNKNLLSGVLLLLLPFLIFGFVYFKSVIKWPFLLICLASLVSVYFLETRSVFLALFLGIMMIVVFFFLRFLKSKSSLNPLWIVYIPVILLVIFFGMLVTNSVLPLAENSGFLSYGTKTGTWLERIVIWTKSIELWKQSPLLGLGIGSWNLEFPLIGMDGLKKGALNTAFISKPHNDLIWILCELGVIGLAIYMTIWTQLLKRLLQRFVSEKTINWFPLLIGLGLTFYFIFSFFSFPKERIEHIVFLGVYMAIATHLGNDHIKHISISSSIRRSTYVIGILILGFNVFFGIQRLKIEKIATLQSEAYLKEDYESLQKYLNTNDRWYSVSSIGTPIAFYDGAFHLSQEKYKNAITSLEKAKVQNPGFIATYINLGLSYFNTKNYPKAEENFLQAYQISSNHSDTLYNLSLLYLYQGLFEESRNYALKLSNKDPRKPSLLKRLSSY